MPPHPEQTAAPEDYPVLRRLQTRWADNDVYGHVNNTVYYNWFDDAVNGWLLEATGTDIRKLPAFGVVAETSCRYLDELSYPDVPHVGLALEHRGRSSVVYRLAIFREQPDGSTGRTPHALGRFVHVYVDARSRRPTPIPDIIGDALAKLT